MNWFTPPQVPSGLCASAVVSNREKRVAEYFMVFRGFRGVAERKGKEKRRGESRRRIYRSARVCVVCGSAWASKIKVWVGE